MEGGAVPGVSVALINAGTRQTLTTVTDAAGNFGFSLLPPGTYEVEFSAPGFKTSRAAMVVVNVSESPILKAILESGSLDDRIVCNCELSLVAESSGTLVDSKTLTAVPLTTRNTTQIMSMASGSAASVNNAGTLGTGSQVANVNGNTAAGSYTVDGAASANTVPNPDTISEFKIQTSQYDAGYGARVPSTNLIGRSGGNDVHGTLWEFVRNDIFNANSFFQNANGRPKPNLKQNQFGFTVGGPLHKERLFFFGSYQGTRQTNGLDASSLATMLLPPLTDDRSIGSIGSQFCPANHNPGPNNPFYTFAGGARGEGAQVLCDGSNINPVAVKLLQAKITDGSYVIPTPQNIINVTSNGYSYKLGQSSFSLPSKYRENQFVGNVDYVSSKQHTLSGRFYTAGYDTFRQLGASTFAAPATPNVPGFPQDTPGRDYLVSSKLTSILSKNAANEIALTYTRVSAASDGPNDLKTSAIGMTAVDPLLPLMPDITIQGPLGGFRIGNAQNEVQTGTKTLSWADNFSVIHGKHNVRTGFFFARIDSLLADIAPARGKLTVNNFTDFLLGLSAAENGSPTGLSNIQSIDAKEGPGKFGHIDYITRVYNVTTFLEDDLKLAPRVTLNLGVRWEYFVEPIDRTGAQGSAWPSLLDSVRLPPVSGTYTGTTIPANYDPKRINPYTGQPFATPPQGVVVRPNSSYFQNSAPRDSFAPRIGFAWQPGNQQSRISVRGGYGWFYQNPSNYGNAPGFPAVNVQPFAQLFQNSGASNGASSLAKPFPTTTLGYVLRTPSTRLTDRILWPEFNVPRLQQWNLNTQYSLSKTLSFDLGYVGSRGNNLLLGLIYNQPFLASAGNPVNCGLPTTNVYGVDAATFAALGIDPATGCITANSAGNAFLRVPVVGETPSALQAHRYMGRSSYHSMQATLRNQLSHGLTFQIAYTFSKAFSNTTVYNDQRNLSLDWARTNFDRTHRMIANFNYDLPAPRANGLLGTITRGWSMTGIIIVQSGLPLTLTDRSAGSAFGFAAPSTVTLCPGASYDGLATSGKDQARLSNWINKSAVCPAPIVGSGNATGYGNAGQSIMNGPGQFNTDFSFGKVAAVGGLGERKGQLAFRVEFYNALNHPQFSNPGTVAGTSNFGVINQTSVGPRLIQFGMKYVF